MDLRGKNVLITGGARVGQTVASELEGAGAKLAMTYLKDASEVREGAHALPLDVFQEASARALVPLVVEVMGQVDALVNMVSIFVPDSKELSYEEMKKQFTVNAFGNMLVSRLFAEYAREKGLRNVPIVSFIDWAVDHPYANHDVYIAAKAGLRHYLMALQTTFAGVVRIVNIHPGMILEPEGFDPAIKETIIANTPLKMIGTPEHAGKLVRVALEVDYLADNIHLDGGQQWRHRLSD